jgi:hypothetical protein
MVFTNGHYPYAEPRAYLGNGTCEYEGCAMKKNLRLYFGRDRDEIYCGPHLRRTIAAAHSANRSASGSAMERVEKALGAKEPELREETFDEHGRRIPAAIHVHAHRFRKTIGTYYVELGFSIEEVAKLTGWKDPETIRKKYWKPGLAAKQELTESIDIVEMSRRADRGEDMEQFRKRSDVEQMREQLAKKDALIAELSAKIDKLTNAIAELASSGRVHNVRVEP